MEKKNCLLDSTLWLLSCSMSYVKFTWKVTMFNFQCPYFSLMNNGYNNILRYTNAMTLIRWGQILNMLFLPDFVCVCVWMCAYMTWKRFSCCQKEIKIILGKMKNEMVVFMLLFHCNGTNILLIMLNGSVRNQNYYFSFFSFKLLFFVFLTIH